MEKRVCWTFVALAIGNLCIVSINTAALDPLQFDTLRVFVQAGETVKADCEILKCSTGKPQCAFIPCEIDCRNCLKSNRKMDLPLEWLRESKIGTTTKIYIMPTSSGILSCTTSKDYICRRKKHFGLEIS